MMQPQSSQPSQQLAPQYGGQLHVRASFFFLQWFLFFVTPRIVINGQEQRARWGLTSISLPPGNYEISVYFQYFFSKAGRAKTQIQIAPGYATVLLYNAPMFFVFRSGSLKVGQPTALPPGQ